MAVYPSASDTKDVGMFGNGHELGFALQQAKSIGRKTIKIKDFQGTRDWCYCTRRMKNSRIYEGRSSEANGCADSVVSLIVAMGYKRELVCAEKDIKG
jgi:hypothetical protein